MSRLVVLALCSFALCAVPCMAAAKDRLVLYVSIGGENRIAVFNVDPENGKLDPRKGLTLDGAPGSLAVDPTGRFLYAAVRSKNSFATLKIAPPSGELSLVSTSKAIDNPVFVTTDATGKHLLSAYYGAGKVAVHPIGADGRPAAEPSHVLDAGKNPHSILTNSWGYVYAPSTGSDVIQAYILRKETGKLDPLRDRPITADKGSGPRHQRFHPTAPLVFFVNETNSSVTAWRQNCKSGELTKIETLPTLPSDFKGSNTCADIEVTPDGKFLYCSNRGHDSLAAFAIDLAKERLTPLGHTPTEKTPREFAIDPTGKFLYCAGQDSGKLASYRIEADGKLTPLTVYDVGRGPAWVHVQKLKESKE